MEFHSTTILAVRLNGELAMGGDGQVTFQNTVVKHGARKLRRLSQGRVLAGFAGSAADGFTLYERFESKLEKYSGQLSRAAVELAKDWRGDKYLRRLEAMLIVGDAEQLYLLSGAGDVVEPDDGLAAIGSGGNFALAAARGIVKAGDPALSAAQVCRLSMEVAASICPFTNAEFQFETIKLQ